MYHWWKRPCVWLCAIGIVLALLDILMQPCFTLRAQGRFIAVQPAWEGMPCTIRFIHSVQKTPVEENLVVEKDGSFTLLSTRYQSFGVGLPFLEEEGDFREEGDYFIFDNMERHFPSLSLRTGVGTQLTLRVGGREYRLYEHYPPGTKIDLSAGPFLYVLFRR